MPEPITVEVTIDLDSLVARAMNHPGSYDDGIGPAEGPKTIEELVVELAAQQVAKRAIDVSMKEDYRTLRQRVAEVRDDEIRQAVKPLIEEAVTGGIVKTNGFGEKVGDTTTLRDLIVADAQKALTAPTSNSNYGTRNVKTIIQEVIAQQVNAAFTKELTETINVAKAEARAAVQKVASELVAKAMKEVGA